MIADGRDAADLPAAHGVRLLRAERRFARFWLARSASSIGDSLSLVALMLFVADATDAAVAVALLLLVGDFAPALLGPLTGVLADRFDLRRVLVGADLVQAGAVLAMALWLPSLPVLLALVAVRAVAGQVFAPAARSAVPALVADRNLPGANAVLGLGTNGAEAIGPFLAAALLPVLGIRGVLLVDAATFLLSAGLLATVRVGRAPATEEPGSVLADAWAGVRFVLRTPALRAVVLGYVGIVAFNGVDDVALVFLGTETLGAGDAAVAALLGAVGIGLLAGYALLGRTTRTVSMPALLLVGFAVSSAGNLLTGLAWAVAAAFAVQLVRGLGIAAMDVAANTLLPRIVPAAQLGRVFGNLYGAIGVAAAASYLGGALLLDLVGPRTTFVVAGAGGLAATVLTGLALRRA